MGLLNRVKYIFGAKLDKRLDSLEDPKEMLDYSINQMEKSLREITHNALEISTAKKRLEMQEQCNLNSAQKNEQFAKEALALGKEELAKEALFKKNESREQAQSLMEQVTSLNNSLESIVEAKKELQYKIELYRGKKEELKAIYDASKAQIKIKELVTTLGENSKIFMKQ